MDDQTWLISFLQEHDAVAGTVHRCSNEKLNLTASVNIPPVVLEKVKLIPSGKGMAGLALQERRLITTCNLKEDDSGAVKPGAKAVEAKGAVAFPVFAADRVAVVVGMAWAQERDLGEAYGKTLMAAAQNLV